jgi:hypothetical protein
VGIERQGTLTRIVQARENDIGESSVDGLTRSTPKLERIQVVVCEHLGVVSGSPKRPDPLGRSAVLLSPLDPRDLTVSDVTNQDVQKRVLAFTRE